MSQVSKLLKIRRLSILHSKRSQNNQDLTDKPRIYTDTAFTNSFIQVSQSNINIMHNSMYYDGSYTGNYTSTATELMLGGIWVNMSAALPALDLNTTSRNDPIAAPTNALTNWFENLFVTSLINTWFKEINAYVVYVPYGQVNGLNSANSLETFTQDDCNTQWIGGSSWITGIQWNDSLVASCLDGGMAVLYNGGSKINPPSTYEVSFSYTNFTYNPRDMIESSVNSFLKGGFK